MDYQRLYFTHVWSGVFYRYRLLNFDIFWSEKCIVLLNWYGQHIQGKCRYPTECVRMQGFWKNGFFQFNMIPWKHETVLVCFLEGYVKIFIMTQLYHSFTGNSNYVKKHAKFASFKIFYQSGKISPKVNLHFGLLLK